MAREWISISDDDGHVTFYPGDKIRIRIPIEDNKSYHNWVMDYDDLFDVMETGVSLVEWAQKKNVKKGL